MKTPRLDETAIAARLRGAGLRPTRQRLALARLLLGSGDRHVTAEHLHEETTRQGVRVSLATIYNTLHSFTRAGLLKQVVVDAGRFYFDTNTRHHHHFYVEAEQRLIDIQGDAVEVGRLPKPPAGRVIERVDVIVRLKDAPERT
jgi:Fur family iron response transcriptional regulator